MIRAYRERLAGGHPEVDEHLRRAASDDLQIAVLSLVKELRVTVLSCGQEAADGVREVVDVEVDGIDVVENVFLRATSREKSHFNVSSSS